MFKISKNNVIHKIDDVKYIEITGSKNSALPILCSLPLTRGILKIDNIYDYEDILNTICILSQLNIKYFKNSNNQYVFDTNNIILSSTIDGCHKLRASYYFIGSMIHNKTILVYGYPGGCNIGTRKIDEHIRFFEAIGCKIDINKNNIIVDSSNFFYDSSFSFTFKIKSVGATINAILSSVIGIGEIILYNIEIDPIIIINIEKFKRFLLYIVLINNPPFIIYTGSNN